MTKSGKRYQKWDTNSPSSHSNVSYVAWRNQNEEYLIRSLPALEWAQLDAIDWRAKTQKRPLISWQRNCHRKYTSRIVHFLSTIAAFGNKSSPHFLVYRIIKLNLERYVPLIMMIRSRYSCENTVIPISMKCSPHVVYLHHHFLWISTTLWLLGCEE